MFKKKKKKLAWICWGDVSGFRVLPASHMPEHWFSITHDSGFTIRTSKLESS